MSGEGNSLAQKTRSFVTDGAATLHGVVYRDAPDRQQRVTILSGGGSGHEPAHAGFVGTNMLDAAVCGSIFASPNAAQIECGLRHIQSPNGTLIIVKNYTGDKLNFTLAADRFRLATAQPIRLLVVADDVSIGRSKSALVGRRGLSGTTLIHKISGAAASDGVDLDGIVEIAEFAMDNMGTIGLGLDGCQIPGQASNNSRLANDEIEIGIGIHNEPGSRRISPRPSLEDLVKGLLSNLLDEDPERNYIATPPKADMTDIVVQINNLGSLSALEMLAITNEITSQLHNTYGLKPVRVYCGTFLSALNCPGFSITLLSLPRASKHSPTIIKYLDESTDAVGWPSHLAKATWESPVSASQSDVSTKDGKPSQDTPSVPCDESLFETILKSIHELLVFSEPEITRNDTILGDGDCGTTLVDGATSIIKALEDNTINTSSLSHGMLEIADLLSLSMGGTSGALYAVFMTAFASNIALQSGSEGASLSTISAGLSHGLRSLEQVTAARCGDRTMMDALIPFTHKFAELAAKNESVLEVFEGARAAAQVGAENTKTLQSRFGRSTYVGAEDGVDSTTGIPDPGATGVVAILDGVKQALVKVYK
ncbi:hypothetical protein V2G26_004227 [Clonostachys chloroleuca]